MIMSGFSMNAIEHDGFENENFQTTGEGTVPWYLHFRLGVSIEHARLPDPHSERPRNCSGRNPEGCPRLARAVQLAHQITRALHEESVSSPSVKALPKHVTSLAIRQLARSVPLLCSKLFSKTFCC